MANDNSSKGQPDDPRQANEAGEPAATGRTHGRVDGETNVGGKADQDTGSGAKGNTGKVGADLESGRQGA